MRLRLVVDFFRCAELLKAPAAHDRDAVGHVDGLFLIVGDVDEGDAQLLLQALELKLHLAAELQIQRAQRFIQQQQLRFGRERAGDGDALALAAGKLAGHAFGKIRHLHQLEHLAHALFDGGFIHPAHTQAVGHVLFDIHMRKERVALKDRVDGAALRRQRGDVPAVQQHRALVRRFQAGDNAQGRRLAAAGRAQQRDELAPGDVQRDIAQNVALAEILGNVL